MTKFDPTDKYKKVKCPYCQSASKEKNVSVPNFAFANPVGTDKWTSASQGHDYRFKHNIPKVKKERATAEALSKVGKNPYRSIDDISDGKNFGEVK